MGIEPAGREKLVELKAVAKSFGPVTAVHSLDLTIHCGEFLAILGPSGCGKTTLLRMIGGFIRPTAGTIMIGGRDVTRLTPEHRPTNMVFQGYGLFPHMNVAQNIGYGLRIAKTPKEEIQQRVSAAMDLVRLGDLADRMVTQLSGGQAQRVALARALIMRPDVLLLDEPLAALDLKLRKAMQEELRRIHGTTGGTFVFVTHDQEEAMALASRICVMEGGCIIQDDAPEEIYRFPRSRFVSTFIGEANILTGRRDSNEVVLDGGSRFENVGPDEQIVCVVRPEKIQIRPCGCDHLDTDLFVELEGTLEDVVFLGPYVKYSVHLANGQTISVDSRDTGERQSLKIGDRVLVTWQWADQQVLADS